MKILATDDDPIILELLSKFILETGQNDITTVNSGEEALALLTRQGTEDFDCFFNDIQMPGINGIELTHAIRKLPAYASTPIIMLTTLSQKDQIDGAFAAGATDYMTKPLDLSEFKVRFKTVEQMVHANAQAPDEHTVPDAILDAQAELDLQGIPNVITSTAMENYIAQLSRSSLFGSAMFAFSLRQTETYAASLSQADFKTLIEDVAGGISHSLSKHQFLMSYSGDGTFTCITESGWRPEMSDLMNAVNKYLTSTRVLNKISNDCLPLVSAGTAIRVVWKSSSQIVNALHMARMSADMAAAEFDGPQNGTDDFRKYG